MDKRTWTYEEITTTAERQISNNMRLSASSQAKGDEWAANHLANFAWGVWHMWDVLTIGWQEPGDSKRLQAMTEREVQVPHG